MGIILAEKCKKLFKGEVTMKKRDLWLLGADCVLLGIVIGFMKAPLTHGITISCGNNNGNMTIYGNEEENQETEENE